MGNKKRIKYTAIPRNEDLAEEIKRRLKSKHYKCKNHEDDKKQEVKEPDIVDLSACAGYAMADINDIYINSVDKIETIYFANKDKSKVVDLATSRLVTIEDKIPLTSIIFDYNLDNDTIRVLRKFFHITRSAGYISKYDYEDSSYNNSKYMLSDLVEMAVSLVSSIACKEF